MLIELSILALKAPLSIVMMIICIFYQGCLIKLFWLRNVIFGTDQFQLHKDFHRKLLANFWVLYKIKYINPMKAVNDPKMTNNIWLLDRMTKHHTIMNSINIRNLIQIFFNIVLTEAFFWNLRTSFSNNASSEISKLKRHTTIWTRGLYSRYLDSLP